DDHVVIPESERAVLLERRHAAQNALVHEVRKAPLHGLFHIRARGVDELADVGQDRFGEVSGLGNIGINARIFGSHEGPAYKKFADRSTPATVAFASYSSRQCSHPPSVYTMNS